MKAKLRRRIACLSLTAVMTVSLAAGNALAFAKNGGSTVSAARFDTVTTEDVTGKIDLTGIAVQNLSPQVLENAGYTTSGVKRVIVTLDGDSVIDSLPENSTVSDYVSTYSGGKIVKSIQSAQTNVLNSISSLGIKFNEVYRYNTVTNAVSIDVDTAYLPQIRNIAGVKSASVANVYDYPQAVEGSESTTATVNPNSVYPTGIYDSSKYLSEYDGSGMTVAILDTGLDYSHPAFNVMPTELAMDRTDVARKIAEKDFKATVNGREVSVSDVYVNDKVPFAYDYADNDADVYPSYSQHGTHVAGIVAGQADSYINKDGETAKDSEGNDIPFRGVAPNAQLVICKVFTDDFESKDLGGAVEDDIIAALEDCVNLGVDIINMSLGTAAGFSSIEIEGDEKGERLNGVYQNVRDAGINLMAAASNEYSSGYGSAFGTNLATNPDSGTVGSPSTFVGAMSVASINGQSSPYMIANGTSAIFYTDSSDENAVRFDFLKQLIYDSETDSYVSEEFKYVIVPGIGQPADYTPEIVRELNDKSQGRTIAVIKRGTTTFKDKIETLMTMSDADAVIIYNNVAGSIGMSVGEIDDPLPAVSVSMDAGRLLAYDENNVRRTTGKIVLNAGYQAGPFMNDYSSWGSTPDLKLKPDVTSHGGEITSTVPGGYNEQSGTSMATPNLAGFAALLRGKIKSDYPEYADNPLMLTKLTNQIIMSTAVTVYDQDGLPYSPRKQGAGLATLDNVFTTKAYLWTEEAEDNRPKVELGEDEKKEGVYTLEFYVKNTGSTPLEFTTQSIFMTETLASDGMAVAEKAYILNDVPAEWTVGGTALSEGAAFTVNGGEDKKITVKLTLSSAEKRYLDNTFPNGMFVEGFLKLNSNTSGQCGLTLPFMGFYGDWESGEMLDYDAYEIAEFEKDTTYTDETRPRAQIWATQAYATYYNNKYSVPLGSFAYTQDENADQIYAEMEHSAISRYNIYEGADATSNYMTTVGIKALYAGLLRNAELVTYNLYDDETGEIIKQDNIYRVNKAISGGGSAVPAQVLLELDPDELGLVNNGKYRIDFSFYFSADDRDNPDKQDNTFSMTFYVDYEAPVLVDSRIRYYDYKENNRDKQRVYLDLDIFDNTYAQSVLLCYSDGYAEDGTTPKLQLATEYITPVYNANKNGVTTVSIEITDFYEKYNERLYVQIEDYALNHRISRISFSNSTASQLPSEFEIVGATEITLGVNQTYKVALNYEGEANLSNFSWISSKSTVAKVRNGEIFAVAPGQSTVTVRGANGSVRKITVNVVESNTQLTTPSISFAAIKDYNDNLTAASGAVKVKAGNTFALTVVCDPWYYPVTSLNLKWESTDSSVASVDEYGNVTTYDKKGSAYVSASIVENGIEISSAGVLLDVQEPFRVSGSTLTAYNGTGGTDGVVVLPTDKNIMVIGEEAFKDNDNIRVIVIPKTVTQISERAFVNCTALEEVYFVSQEKQQVADADLANILRNAFQGCTSLKKVDFTNCKVVTLDKQVFAGCTALEEVVAMQKIGTAGDMAFYGCTSLKEADVSELHICGSYVFADCTSLNKVTTDKYTSIGIGAFAGCTALESVNINTANVSDGAFAGCIKLNTVTFGDASAADKSMEFTIGEQAFYGCTKLATVNFNGYKVTSIKAFAFADCRSLTTFALPEGLTFLGERVFERTPVQITSGGSYSVDTFGAVYEGTKLILAPKTITSAFEIDAAATEIAPYAFSGCLFEVDSVNLQNVTKIGEGAFANSQLRQINLTSGITEIAAYAFSGTALKQVNIPAVVTGIGEGAFAGCTQLSEVNFATSSNLKTIGEGAFYGCTSLTEIALPAGAENMGGRVFEGCTSLQTAVMPAVKTLGARTFANCTALDSVTFADGAQLIGEYTFANCAALTSVSFGTDVKEIGAYAFSGCKNLESINLRNATVIGDGAFANCISLSEITGIEKVVEIGSYAFTGCTAISSLNLESAVIIGSYAFANGNYTEINLPKVKSIGGYAFFGGKEREVKLPATLVSVGAAAFASSENLREITVDEANGIFFSQDGVLYRKLNLAGGETAYELCAYPSAKNSPAGEGSVRTYSVLEGTVTIQAYAFLNVNNGAIARVLLPYSLKTIGAGAFYNSHVAEYRFESINAPVLLTNFNPTEENESIYQLYLFYDNFGDEFINHVLLIMEPVASSTRIYYPTNGIGYDNYVYSNYFGMVTLLGELLDDTTRSLINMIENFFTVEEINEWLSLEVNDENRKMVSDFALRVANAHAIYNTIVSEVQLEMLGDRAQRLTDTETALKAVKAHFGISATAVSLTVSPDSEHKTQYVAGEKFDMTGLKLIVTYDDYTTEIADPSKLNVSTRYEEGLTVLDVYVVVEGYGTSVRISVSVSEDGGEGSNGGTEKKVNVGAIVGGIVGGICGLALIAGAVVFVLWYRKKKAANASEEEEVKTEDSAEKASGEETDVKVEEKTEELNDKSVEEKTQSEQEE